MSAFRAAHEAGDAKATLDRAIRRGRRARHRRWRLAVPSAITETHSTARGLPAGRPTTPLEYHPTC